MSKKLISEFFRKLKVSDISETNLHEFTLVHSLFLRRNISYFYNKSENFHYYQKSEISDNWALFYDAGKKQHYRQIIYYATF